MRQLSVRNKDSNRSGYLLVEGLISLIVSVLAIWTITVMLLFVSRQSQNQTINFYAYIQLLESQHYRFQTIEVGNEDVLLYSPVTHKRYHMAKYQNMIRLTGVHLGHIRALVGVKDVDWRRQNGGLITDVTFANGQVCHAYSPLVKHHE
ncbi:hypothetical protein FEZ41_00920 [Lentilactobacillus parafarraginis]|jgi:competence protein ComGF|uniref:Competence protein ComGF n=2 Tax=Lentilactobacillus parafarraginis TaxID=390842 RepID=A0A0R1YS18_9LACO|nr:competence type IV pilus minor pilin ComGF [Lentilactobacillus parafarraginis]KRM45390.1 hypothetical protein FD47_GL001799 [Lentilactobacillus parafarraginis DSM 18390 = JCM 14109]TLQ20961.1 hypothetical protein FEZ41_00920 [Lentilactobacillus parafarraginis]